MIKKEDGTLTFKAAPEDFPQKHKAAILNIGIAETGTEHTECLFCLFYYYYYYCVYKRHLLPIAKMYWMLILVKSCFPYCGNRWMFYGYLFQL